MVRKTQTLEQDTQELARAIMTLKEIDIKLREDLGIPQEEIANIMYKIRSNAPIFAGFWRVKRNRRK